MIRSLFLRLLVGLVLVSHALALAGVCDCVAPPLEEASVAMSSCHEESGLSISRPADCCCGDEQADPRGDALAAGVSQATASAPALLASPAPPATAAIPAARTAHVMNRRGPSLPRPPLRV